MEKVFGLSGDQEPDGHSSWAPWSYIQIGEIYRRTNITATLHRSGLYRSVAKLNPLLSVDTWNLQKKHLKDPQTVRNQILWSDEPQFQASCSKESRHCSSHAEYYVLKVKCAGSSLMLWDCFSAAGLRDSSEWKKSSKHQNIEMKTQSRAFRTSDGQNIYFPTGQWP